MMKQNTDENVFVICPFYKCQSKQVIYCEGPDESSAIHVAFATQQSLKSYAERYCRKYWGGCLIADAQNRRYNGK